MKTWKTQIKGLEDLKFDENNFPIFPPEERYEDYCWEKGILYEGPPEISVITEDFEQGKESYGWECPNKIIISNHTDDFDELKFYIKVANILTEELNRKGVAPPELPAPARKVNA